MTEARVVVIVAAIGLAVLVSPLWLLLLLLLLFV
jgi:hypothetical protein